MQSSLNYSILGTGENIVLIHGWGTGINIWSNVAKELAKSFQVTLFDLPGYGSNYKLSNNHLLPNICEKIATIIPANSILLGWSMGGLIAIWLASHYPHLVAKLIIVNGTPCFLAKTNWPGISLKVLNSFKNLVEKNWFRALLHFISLQTNNNLKQSRVLKKNIDVKTICSPNILIEGINILLSSDLRPNMGNIKAPTLFILGEHDLIVPSAISQHLSFNSDIQTKILANANHVPFIFQFHDFLHVVKKFIDEK